MDARDPALLRADRLVSATRTLVGTPDPEPEPTPTPATWTLSTGSSSVSNSGGAYWYVLYNPS
jgi:hypothetical protein